MSLGTQFGLLSTGFIPKAITDITADLQAAMKSAFGASINVTPQSRFGQIIGIIAERYLELWNLAGAVHAAFNPDNALGQDLVNVAAITGTLPVIPTSSTVTETLTGTPNTLCPAGRQVAVQGTLSVFNTLADATITALTAWAAYSPLLGDRRTNGGNAYQCITAGTSVTGPSGTGVDIIDGGTAHWTYLGVGTGAIDVAMSSALTGPIIASARTLTLIQTPVAGWSSAINLLDAVLGVAVESTAAFRLRREAELHGLGRAAVQAIQAAILKLTGVTACTVFENTTDAVNSDGMPPHSIEVLVQGGDPTAICTAIFLNTAAGINTTGNQASINITDSQGIVHPIFFSRPVLVNIYVIANVIMNSAQMPSGGVAAVQTSVTNNILAYAATLIADFDVFSSQIAAAIIAGIPFPLPAILGVPGMLDAGTPFIGLAPSPGTSATISITSRQLASFATARITVNVSQAVP